MLGFPLPGDPHSGLETFDPYGETSLVSSASLYGGAPWCPIDPDGNNLCICAEV